MKKNNFKNGFTLIETIIYMALYAIVIGGVVAGVYAIFDSSGRNATRSMLQEEGIFILGKLDWAMTGAYVMDSPNPHLLSINRSGISAIQNPLVFDLVGTNIRLTRGASSPTIINNTNVEVTNILFIHTVDSGDGLVPESVRSSFTLTARMPSGRLVSQEFATTKYIRK